MFDLKQRRLASALVRKCCTGMASYRKLKTLTSYIDLADFINQSETYCIAPKFPELESPFSDFSGHIVYLHPSYGPVFIVETEHRVFCVFVYDESDVVDSAKK